MTNSGAVECYRCHTPIPENSRYCFSCGADVSGAEGAPNTGSIDALRERLQRLIEGEYRIERLLGKGGMGSVFLAHAAKLDHPNIIPIYRVESEGGLNYFVMKYIAGTSLEDLLEKKEPLAIADIQRILWEASCALGHAHQRGVVHRDVKPANIMFDHDGRVMLTDFGISKALQAATGFTATGMIIGTPHYMAPEQAKGHPVDGRADQYSLGVVGYRMITAELPFSGDSVHTVLYKQIFEEAPLASSKNAAVPPFLATAVARAMSKDPDLRFPTMEDFATAVWPEQPVVAPKKGRKAAGPRVRVTADSPTEITGAPTTPLAPGSARRARPPAAKPRSRTGVVVGVVVVAGIAAAGYLALGRGTASDQAASPPAVDTVRIADTVRLPATERPRSRRPAAPPPSSPAPVEQAQGFITVNANPYGEVYIDGVDAGPTPVVRWPVKPGRHTIRILREGYRTVTEAVQVDAGNTVPKVYTLLPES